VWSPRVSITRMRGAAERFDLRTAKSFVRRAIATGERSAWSSIVERLGRTAVDTWRKLSCAFARSNGARTTIMPVYPQHLGAIPPPGQTRGAMAHARHICVKWQLIGTDSGAKSRESHDAEPALPRVPAQMVCRDDPRCVSATAASMCRTVRPYQDYSAEIWRRWE